jgi:hypothetical protein
VISHQRAHPALVSDADFLAAQTIRATCPPHDDGERRYRLTGLLICAACSRRLQPHWVHGRPAYRCRHGHTSAQFAGDGPRWIYWPEHRILTEALDQLTRGGHLPAHTGADDVLAYLRGKDAVVVCDATTVTIDDPADDGDAAQVHAPSPPEANGRPTFPRQRRSYTSQATESGSRSRTAGTRRSGQTEKPNSAPSLT